MILYGPFGDKNPFEDVNSPPIRDFPSLGRSTYIPKTCAADWELVLQRNLGRARLQTEQMRRILERQTE